MDHSQTIQTVGWVLATFGFLKATSTFLSFVAAKTKSTTDDKIAHGLAKGLEFGAGLIDFFTANGKKN